MCIVGSGVADDWSDKPFRILVAKFSDLTINLLPHQVVATVFAYSETLVESHISHAEVFGLIPKDKDTKFRKRQKSAHDIEKINKNLAEHRD